MIFMHAEKQPVHYCMSKKSCPFLYCEYTKKIGKDFFDILLSDITDPLDGQSDETYYIT